MMFNIAKDRDRSFWSILKSWWLSDFVIDLKNQAACELWNINEFHRVHFVPNSRTFTNVSLLRRRSIFVFKHESLSVIILMITSLRTNTNTIDILMHLFVRYRHVSEKLLPFRVFQHSSNVHATKFLPGFQYGEFWFQMVFIKFIS